MTDKRLWLAAMAPVCMLKGENVQRTIPGRNASIVELVVGSLESRSGHGSIHDSEVASCFLPDLASAEHPGETTAAARAIPLILLKLPAQSTVSRNVAACWYTIKQR